VAKQSKAVWGCGIISRNQNIPEPPCRNYHHILRFSPEQLSPRDSKSPLYSTFTSPHSPTPVAQSVVVSTLVLGWWIRTFPLVIVYILWMGQRNPNHQLKTVVNIPLFIGFQPKVVQDFATTHRSYGKITIWIGKSTVNGKLSRAMWVSWRVTQEKIYQITVVMINISDGYLEAYLRWNMVFKRLLNNYLLRRHQVKTLWLVVDLPLWKIWKSNGISGHNIWKNNKCSKPPPRIMFTNDADVP
jgi:hypothetical protein